MNHITIWEMFHPEEREVAPCEHKATKEDKIRKIKSRIDLLKGRQPLKENQAIVRKLERELRRIEG